MASGDQRPAEESIDGRGLTVGIVSAKWNPSIVTRLRDGAESAIARTGATARHAEVPGAFELPFGARALIESGTVDAVVVLGAVIRGETTHYEIVSEGCAQGVMQVQLTTGIPIGLGVLTVENDAQALARSEAAGGHNVGDEATIAAIEMALLAAANRP